MVSNSESEILPFDAGRRDPGNPGRLALVQHSPRLETERSCGDSPLLDTEPTLERMREIGAEIRAAGGNTARGVDDATLTELCNEGWSLLPLDEFKVPLIHEWKPRQTTAVTLAQVLRENRQLQPSVWARVTGSVSGGFTLDFDGSAGEAAHIAFGLEPHRTTPRGGTHVDFLYPDWDVKTVTSIQPGVDVRGRGGYIGIVGTSIDGVYETVGQHDPYSVDVLPTDFRDLLVAAPEFDSDVCPSIDGQPSSARALASGASWLETAVDAAQQIGMSRNEVGLWLACQLRDAGFTESEARAQMLEYQTLVPPVDASGRIAPYTQREALASLRQACSRPPRQPAHRQVRLPEIVTQNSPLRDRVDAAVDALVQANEPPTRFIRDGHLVRIVFDEIDRVWVESYDRDSLIGDLSRVADWVKSPGEVDESGHWRPGPNIDPQAVVAKTLLSEHWTEQFPPLVGVANSPTLRTDGTIVAESGYDSATKVFVSIPANLTQRSVADDPSAEEIAEAISLIQGELLGEFEFADSASQANAIGFILTTVLRPSIRGRVPMILVDAPSKGTGKTLLAKLAGLISSGSESGMTTAPSGNEEELRKKLFSMLFRGEPLIIFDNLDTVLKSSVLASVITSGEISDRRLNESVTPRIKWEGVLVTTGNNIRLGGDMDRRCIPIRLDSKVTKAWTRDFKRQDIEGWVLEHRGDLLWACLTLGRAWFASGMPHADLPPFANFQPWQDMIGGILSIAGVDDFLSNLRDLQDQGDPDSVRVESLFEFLFEETAGRATSSKDLLQYVRTFELCHELPSSLVDRLEAAKTPAAQTLAVSNFLESHRDDRKNAAGLRCVKAPEDLHRKVSMWKFAVNEPAQLESRGGGR